MSALVRDGSERGLGLRNLVDEQVARADVRGRQKGATENGSFNPLLVVMPSRVFSLRCIRRRR
jgi:hypothetical protein